MVGYDVKCFFLNFECAVEVIVPATWEIEVGGRVVASRTQTPLNCAWALSIHKSQVTVYELVAIAVLFEFLCDSFIMGRSGPVKFSYFLKFPQPTSIAPCFCSAVTARF